MAHGILEAELARRGRSDIIVDSAGTSNWHIGNRPDARAIETTARHGIDISGQKARQVTRKDFDSFDLIVAMDAENFADLKAMAPDFDRKQLVKCLNFSSLTSDGDVPDPYYGGRDGFTHAMTLLTDACQGIANHIISTSK